MQGHQANNDQLKANPKSPNSKSFYPLIRLKLRLMKYCTNTCATRRKHSYPSFLPSLFTLQRNHSHLPRSGSITIYFPLSFQSRKEGPGRTFHPRPALTTKKG